MEKTQSACGPAVSGLAGPNHFDANIPIVTDRSVWKTSKPMMSFVFENLPPNVPAKDFWSLLAVTDSAGSSNNSICERLAFSS
jgi:hypothetical protein